MIDETFTKSIAQARERIEALPEEQREPLLQLLSETVQRHHDLKQHFARIQDTVGEWQMMVKYLIFDREATIRERDELRRELGDLES